MIVLDTNVISEIMLPRPERQVLIWLDRQPGSSIWTSSVNIFEIRSGLQSMPVGKRRTSLMDLFERWLVEVVQGRIVNFDEAAARRAADMNALRKEMGRPADSRNTMIAGIVLASHAKLATRNVKHFEDIASSVVNPWEKG
jgi:predicted nucleic acid-binding protein